MSISPRALTELLGRAGYPITERRLTDWRAKRWIADLHRAERPAGTGRGAHYMWADGEIIAHVFTLLSMLELRGRMGMASVLAWFSGFDLPRDDIRDLWVAFEAASWKKTLRLALAGEEGSAKEAVDMLVIEEQYKQRKKKDGYSNAFIDIIARMGIDPDFDARTHLPRERLAKILTGDVPKLGGAEAELAPMLSADVVRSLAILVQDYWSSPRLIAVIQSIPDEMLSKAHADVRFLLSPYRALLESSVSKVAGGCSTDFERFEGPLLWAGPRLAWQAGRLLIRLDIALRRLGHGDEVDTTITMLRDLAATDETRDVVKVFKEHRQAWARSDASGLAEDVSSGLDQELMRDAAFDQAAEAFKPIGSALTDLWLPRLQQALAETSMEGTENPAAPATRQRNRMPGD